MSYVVQFVSKRVEKEFKSFGKEESKAIQDAMLVLAENPRPVHLDYGSVNRCTDVKRIKAKRVRLFYTIDEKRELVHIGKIDNRDSYSYGKNPREWFNVGGQPTF